MLRSSGILLHPTSLPGRYGIGDLGPEAYRFIDFLYTSGQTLWQVLPLGPAGPLNSPYAASSAFAGNVLMISPDLLVRDGLVAEHLLAEVPDFSDRAVDFGAVIPYKMAVLNEAFRAFQERRGTQFAHLQLEYTQFCSLNSQWLNDYALFRTLKDRDESRVWNQWETGLVRREAGMVREARHAFAETIEKHCFWQYLFFRQWAAMKEYAQSKNIKLIGDIPIFVAYDSADVWSHPGLFKLDADLKPTVVSGVPPDYFSPTGQLWGTPLYNWNALRETNFQWWIDRIDHMLDLVDYIRIDHFRGFAGCWEVPASDETAEFGSWVSVPGHEFLTAAENALGKLPVLAEDLGLITPDVHALRDAFDFPGMRILQFAFSSSAMVPAFIPHNYIRNTVAYTGTHDNNTTLGWYRSESQEARQQCVDYLTSDGAHGMSTQDFERIVSRRFIREVLASVADTALFPMQDILGFDGSARMNFPGDGEDRWWRWRFVWHDIWDALPFELHRLTAMHGRLRSRFPQKRVPNQ